MRLPRSFARLRYCIWLLVLAGAALPAQDISCPAYPASVRTENEQSLDLDRRLAEYSKLARQRQAASPAPNSALAQSSNFIDQLVYKKMAEDGVAPAPRTTDAEFLRRVSLDLTGRIPTPGQAAAFLTDSGDAKRQQWIETSLASPAYADQLTLFLANRYRVTRAFESISTPARDVFYNYVHDLFAKDLPYDAWARQLLSASGDVDSTPGTQFFARWMDLAGPIQDSWDNITEKITTSFLGYKTECVSCHNGRAHLEKINLYLSRRTRADFLEHVGIPFADASSCGSATIRSVSGPRSWWWIAALGGYSGSVPPTNPGCRPARIDAVVTPVLFTTGENPRPASGARSWAGW